MGRLDQQFPSPEKIFGDYNLPQDGRVMEILRDPFAGGMAGYSNNTPGAPQSGFGQQAGSALRGINNGRKLYNFLNAGAGSDAAIAGLGGAGSALSGMGGGRVAGTVGYNAGALGGMGGFLPSYAAAGGPMASGIFGGAAGAGTAGSAAGGAAATGAGGASAGGAGAGAGSLGAMAGAAIPAAVLIGGILSMFQSGTQPEDLSASWKANQGGLTPENFNNFRAASPHLDALVGQASQGGGFDLNRFNEALGKSTVGGKSFTDQGLQDAQQFGQFIAQNPNILQGPAATQEAWWSPYAQGTPSN